MSDEHVPIKCRVFVEEGRKIGLRSCLRSLIGTAWSLVKFYVTGQVLCNSIFFSWFIMQIFPLSYAPFHMFLN